MKDLRASIQEVLGKQLSAEGYDVVDLIPIPAKGDKMVKIRTIEEALDEFDSTDQEDTSGYLIQVRRKQSPSTAQKVTVDGVYLHNGKLNLPYLLRNAELLFSAGEYALARNIYKTIHQSGERSSMALYRMGRCFEAEGKMKEAEASYDQSIAYQPSFETYQRLAALLIRGKKDQEAAEVMERAINNKDIPRSTRYELHKACGNCWSRVKQTERAERHYRAALEIDPTADSAQANLGALYLQAERIPEALRCFQDAIAANARNDKAHAGLGSCYLAEGQKRLAHDAFARALDINLNNPTAIFHLVKCAYEIKSYATAARIVGEYVDSNPVNMSLLYSLAGLQFHLGRLQEAKSTVKRILELQPQHSGAMELMKMIDRYSGS